VQHQSPVKRRLTQHLTHEDGIIEPCLKPLERKFQIKEKYLGHENLITGKILGHMKIPL